MPDQITDEFEDLVAQLQADRPSIDAEFARVLDERATAGFPRGRRRFAWPHLNLWMPAGGLAVAAVAAVIAVGVAGDGGRSTGGGDASSSVATAPEAPAAEDSSGGGAAAGQAFESQAAPGTAQRQVVPPIAGAEAQPDLSRNRVQEQSTSITLETPADEIAAAGDKILAVVNEFDGFVESSNLRATEDGGSGSYQLRIPVDRLGDAIAALSRIGDVTEQTTGSQDITSERNVARERLQEAKAVRQSLLNRLAAADTDAEVESLRAQLRSVDAQIGSARGALRHVQRRAAYAVVSLTLVAADEDSGGGAADPYDQWTPGDALKDAGRVLEVVAGVALVSLAVLLPFGLLVAAGLATRRALGKRRRERALDAM